MGWVIIYLGIDFNCIMSKMDVSFLIGMCLVLIEFDKL